MKDDKKEKVIFRREYNPYQKVWNYLACFPDDEKETNWSYIGCIPFYLEDENNPDTWVREPYSSMSYSYYYGTKIIHKNDPIIPTLVATLNSMELQDGTDYDGWKVVEKIIR